MDQAPLNHLAVGASWEVSPPASAGAPPTHIPVPPSGSSPSSSLWGLSDEQREKLRTTAPSLTCPYEGCAKVFTHSSARAVHIRRAHTKEKPFKCETCGKSFVSSGGLCKHRVVHLDVYNYPCTWVGCEAKFKFSRAMKYHVRAMHTMDRPYKCEEPECDKTFMRREHLGAHAKKHERQRTKAAAVLPAGGKAGGKASGKARGKAGGKARGKAAGNAGGRAPRAGRTSGEGGAGEAGGSAGGAGRAGGPDERGRRGESGPAPWFCHNTNGAFGAGGTLAGGTGWAGRVRERSTEKAAAIPYDHILGVRGIVGNEGERLVLYRIAVAQLQEELRPLQPEGGGGGGTAAGLRGGVGGWHSQGPGGGLRGGGKRRRASAAESDNLTSIADCIDRNPDDLKVANAGVNKLTCERAKHLLDWAENNLEEFDQIRLRGGVDHLRVIVQLMEENDSASLLARMTEADRGEAETIELQIVRLCVVALTTPAEDPSDTVEVSGPRGILSLIGAMIPATLLPSCSLGAVPRGRRHGGGGLSPWDEPSTTTPPFHDPSDPTMTTTPPFDVATTPPYTTTPPYSDPSAEPQQAWEESGGVGAMWGAWGEGEEGGDYVGAAVASFASPDLSNNSARSMEGRETDGVSAGAAAFHHIATRALRYGGTAVEDGGSSSAGSTSDTYVLRGLRLRDPSNAWERSRIEHYLQFLASAMAEKNCSTVQVVAKLEQMTTDLKNQKQALAQQTANARRIKETKKKTKQQKKLCSRPECTTPAQAGGNCILHGGGRRCSAAMCKSGAQTRGLCKRHKKQQEEGLIVLGPDGVTFIAVVPRSPVLAPSTRRVVMTAATTTGATCSDLHDLSSMDGEERRRSSGELWPLHNLQLPMLEGMAGEAGGPEAYSQTLTSLHGAAAPLSPNPFLGGNGGGIGTPLTADDYWSIKATFGGIMHDGERRVASGEELWPLDVVGLGDT